jgi:amidophosphoribosyltransferase
MCGIFAIFSNEYKNLLKKLINGMKLLQHRGKDGYGIVYLQRQLLINIKESGEVNSNKLKTNNKCYSCIGHLRYSTSGSSIKTGIVKQLEMQPIRGDDDQFGTFYIAHNGNIPNIKNHDTTYLKDLIMNYKEDTFEKKLIRLINEIPGAYTLVILTSSNTLYVIRDRFGIRPLCLGSSNEEYYVSSESCAFSDDIKYIRDVNPGELLRIDENGIKTLYNHPTSKLCLCSFEILYFLNENSYTDGLYIKNIRYNLGKILALKENIVKPEDQPTVIGIPLTGICSGKAYAKTIGYNYQQLITKNKNISRTFIIINNEKRKETCEKKFIYDIENIKDKNIVIVDDTIVRGNVIKSIIRNLKKYGAKEIHVRIPAPPVIDICELGISIQSKNELIMNNKTVNQVCNEIGATSLVYLDIEELAYFPKSSYNQCFSGYIDQEIYGNKNINYSNQLNH